MKTVLHNLIDLPIPPRLAQEPSMYLDFVRFDQPLTGVIKVFGSQGQMTGKEQVTLQAGAFLLGKYTYQSKELVKKRNFVFLECMRGDPGAPRIPLRALSNLHASTRQGRQQSVISVVHHVHAVPFLCCPDMKAWACEIPPGEVDAACKLVTADLQPFGIIVTDQTCEFSDEEELQPED